MEQEFMGREGFVWAVGVVEDRNDPLYLGRCKVRYLGWHTRDKLELPTKTLPWSFPLMPLTSASQTQVGTSPTGPVPGTWVLSFFKDGEDASDPIMLGTLPGRPDRACDPEDGFNDPRMWSPKPFQIDEDTGMIIDGEVEFKDLPQFPLDVRFDRDQGVRIIERTDDPTKHPEKEYWEFSYNFPNIRFLNEPTTPRLARGFKDASANLLNKIKPGSDIGTFVVEGNSDSPLQLKSNLRMPTDGVRASGRAERRAFREPPSPYNAQYPYNHVHQTESGHVIEMDDTPTAERLHWMHRSGSYTEMGPAGDVVTKASRDNWSCCLRDSYEQIGANKFSSVNYGYELCVAALGGSEDYWLRVAGLGDVHLESEGGNVEIYSKNGVTFVNAKRIEFNAKEMIKMSAPRIRQTRFPRNEPSLNPSEEGEKTGQDMEIAGNQSESIGGAKTVNAGQIGLNTMGAFSTSAQSKNENISHGSEESSQGLNVLLGQSAAGKSISVQNGIVNIRSADAKAQTGGILLHLNELPVSSPASAKSSAAAYMSILPETPISGQIELGSTMSSITMKNNMGEISLGSVENGSAIKLESAGPGGSFIAETALGGKFEITKKGLISIRTETTSLKNILNTLIQHFMDHTHNYMDTLVAGAVPPAMQQMTLPNAATTWHPEILKLQSELATFME